MELEKNVRICMLLDLYGALLTEKQLRLLKLPCEEDMSLAEIAELAGISRQGVRDCLVKGEAVLNGFEQKLCLLSRRQALEALVRRLHSEPLSEALLEEFDRLTEDLHGV